MNWNRIFPVETSFLEFLYPYGTECLHSHLDKNKEKNLFCLSITNVCKLPSLLPSFFFLVTWLSVSSFWNMLFSHWTWLLFSCSESLLQAIWKYSLQTEILKDFILQMHCQKDECGNCDGSARLWYLLLV